jgi:hypothetical protein
MMSTNDTKEPSTTFRIIDRFFQVNGEWYFSAGEGEIGPFRSRDQAQREAEAFIRAKAGT